MLTALVTGVVTVLPLVAVAGVLMLVERMHRVRGERVAWQIAVTDAIHRELGAVVAPSIDTRPWSRPRLVIPVPFDRPGLVASVLAIAHGVLLGWSGSAARRVEIVVVPQGGPPRAHMARAA
jgi:hypothetical protein